MDTDYPRQREAFIRLVSFYSSSMSVFVACRLHFIIEVRNSCEKRDKSHVFQNRRKNTDLVEDSFVMRDEFKFNIEKKH